MDFINVALGLLAVVATIVAVHAFEPRPMTLEEMADDATSNPPNEREEARKRA